MMENSTFCQSCGMPLASQSNEFGTNADGSKNLDYCHYCYENGNFTKDETMEDMIASCVPFIVESHPEMSRESAAQMMRTLLPTLKRWAVKA